MCIHQCAVAERTFSSTSWMTAHYELLLSASHFLFSPCLNYSTNSKPYCKQFMWENFSDVQEGQFSFSLCSLCFCRFANFLFCACGNNNLKRPICVNRHMFLHASLLLQLWYVSNCSHLTSPNKTKPAYENRPLKLCFICRSFIKTQRRRATFIPNAVLLLNSWHPSTQHYHHIQYIPISPTPP